jgi:TonB family protein
MRLRSVALGLLACSTLAFVTAAQEPPAGKVDVVLETDTDLDYTSRLHNRIVLHAQAAAVAITDSGEVRVRFRIRRDGEAQKPIISLSSSKPVLDDTALKAVTDALAHTEPLPPEITRSFVDFQARFLFNQAEQPKQEATSLADLARQRSKRSADGEKKVFTNEEVATTPDPEPASPRKGSASKRTSTSTKAKSSASSTSEKSSSDEKPPELTRDHYYQRLQPLRDQLSGVTEEITRLRYYTPQTTAGMPTISNSQKNELERLERKKSDIEKRIAAICQEAARNDISISGCPFY